MQNTLKEFRGRVAIGNADLIYNKCIKAVKRDAKF